MEFTVSGTTLHAALALAICFSISSCNSNEQYVVSESSTQMMIVDRIDRNGPEPKARITIISSKSEQSEINDWLVRRLSFSVRFRCAEGALLYGASVAQLETGPTIRAPETSAAWEHPSPGTGKANAVKVVCEPSVANIVRETRTLDHLEHEYRNQH